MQQQLLGQVRQQVIGDWLADAIGFFDTYGNAETHNAIPLCVPHVDNYSVSNYGLNTNTIIVVVTPGDSCVRCFEG